MGHPVYTKTFFLALHFAATKGHASVVELLINDKGANNINSKTAEGFTPLYRAARYGREAVIKLLVNKGMCVGQNPVKKSGSIRILKILP